MADFPDIDAADPSTEEAQANKRALTMGLIAGGLGILAQPRYRGEPASVPIAQGALGGLGAYEGSLEDSAQNRFKNRELNIEQGRYQNESANQAIMRQQNQQRLDIDQQNSQGLERDRQATEAEKNRLTAPVGQTGVDRVKAYRAVPELAPMFAGLSDDAIAKMPYSDYKDLINSAETTRREVMKPDMDFATSTIMGPDGKTPIVSGHIFNKKTGAITTVDMGNAVPKGSGRSSDQQVRMNAYKQVHPDATDQEALDYIDSKKEDVAVETAARKLKDTTAAREGLATYSNSLKSAEDVSKALTQPKKIGDYVYKGSLDKDPSTGAPAIRWDVTNPGMSGKLFGAPPPIFTPITAPGVVGARTNPAMTPGKVNLPDAVMPKLKAALKDGQVANIEIGGKPLRVKRVGDDFYDVSAHGGSAPVAAPASAPMAAAPAAAPTAAPAPGGAAPAAPAPAPATAPVAAKPLPMKPYLRNGKPLRNGAGEYVFSDGKNLYRSKSAAGPFIPLGPAPAGA